LFYLNNVEPVYTFKLDCNARCIECHEPGAGTLRL
jgi:hypothetical protein